MTPPGRVGKSVLARALAARAGLELPAALGCLDALREVLREQLRAGSVVEIDDLLALSVSGEAEIREDESGGFSAYAPAKKGIEAEPIGAFRKDLQTACRSTIYYLSGGEGRFVQLLSDHFGRRGWKVAHLRNGHEVMNRMDRNPPVAVVFESHVEGWRELLRELKCNPLTNGVPAVGLFPAGALDEPVAALQVEPDDVLCEPFDFAAFIRTAGAELATRVLSPPGERAIELEVSLSGAARDRQQARVLVEELLYRTGLPEAFSRDAGLALAEALDNAARHGHQNVECCTIGLRVILDPRRLVLAVRDSGMGFDHASVLAAARRKGNGETSTTEPLRKAAEALRSRNGEAREGGIHRMLALVDRVEYNRLGNEVVLIKLRPEE